MSTSRHLESNHTQPHLHGLQTTQKKGTTMFSSTTHTEFFSGKQMEFTLRKSPPTCLACLESVRNEPRQLQTQLMPG